MRKTLMVAALAAAMSAPALAGGDMQAQVAESRAAAKALLGELKGALQSAMKEGGPVAAVDVCHDKAQELTEQVSAEKGFDVARTSHKLRNPVNAPDAWEKEVLAEFLARRAAGEDPKQIEQWTVVEQDGQKTFRYMKAIPTGEVCLVCHGTDIPGQVAETIDRYYPEDQARGFAKGDIRGAFTISQPM